MHNVVAWITQALPGYLVLSNTSAMAGRLSFPKPPRRNSSFAAVLSVTDRIPSLCALREHPKDPFRDPSTTVPFSSGQRACFQALVTVNNPVIPVPNQALGRLNRGNQGIQPYPGCSGNQGTQPWLPPSLPPPGAQSLQENSPFLPKARRAQDAK